LQDNYVEELLNKGKISEVRALFDTLGQMQQLGIILLPGQAK
jgi:hypothetical protein